jgi:hypothetical protein
MYPYLHLPSFITFIEELQLCYRFQDDAAEEVTIHGRYHSDQLN